MKKIALITLLFAAMAFTGISAQTNVYVANPSGNAINTYKTSLKNYFNDVLGGFSTVSLVAPNTVADSILQQITIDRNNRKVSAQYLTDVASISGTDKVCYTIIDERNGRLNVEAMLINCSTGNVEKILSQSISRSVNDIRTLVQIFSKKLFF